MCAPGTWFPSNQECSFTLCFMWRIGQVLRRVDPTADANDMFEVLDVDHSQGTRNADNPTSYIQVF